MNAISNILCSIYSREVYSRYIQPEVNIPRADRGHIYIYIEAIDPPTVYYKLFIFHIVYQPTSCTMLKFLYGCTIPVRYINIIILW